MNAETEVTIYPVDDAQIMSLGLDKPSPITRIARPRYSISSGSCSGLTLKPGEYLIVLQKPTIKYRWARCIIATCKNSEEYSDK